MRVRASSFVPSEVDGVRARPDDDVLARTCRGHRRDRYKRGDEHRTHRARALAIERMDDDKRKHAFIYGQHKKNFRELQAKATTPHSSPRTVTMQLRNGEHVLDAYRPTFDPNLDIATVVFSHVQCVKTRHSLALVSKLWRDASKTAAAYPLRFDFDAFPESWHDYAWPPAARVLELLDNDEALSLPYERVVGLLGEGVKYVCNYAAVRGSVRLLKWARENNL